MTQGDGGSILAARGHTTAEGTVALWVQVGTWCWWMSRPGTPHPIFPKGRRKVGDRAESEQRGPSTACSCCVTAGSPVQGGADLGGHLRRPSPTAQRYLGCSKLRPSGPCLVPSLGKCTCHRSRLETACATAGQQDVWVLRSQCGVSV